MVQRRQIVVAVVAVVVSLGGRPFVPGPHVAAETIPSRLTDKAFWQLVTELSEPGGYFRSDNFLSNENAFQTVIPELKSTLPTGGVYLGVGPEQNFTYIVALRPKLAFVDRHPAREPDRAAAVQGVRRNVVDSRRISVPPVRAKASERALERRDCRGVVCRVRGRDAERSVVQGQPSGGQGSACERSQVRIVARRSQEPRIRVLGLLPWRSGSELLVFAIGSRRLRRRVPELPRTDDRDRRSGREAQLSRHGGKLSTTCASTRKTTRSCRWSATSAATRRFERSATTYAHTSATVTAFYTSNVEQYLFQEAYAWRKFLQNVATFPIDGQEHVHPIDLEPRASLSRSFAGFRRAPAPRPRFRSIPEVVKAFNVGQVHEYTDVVTMSK